jgi:hypothetical protein
MENAMPKFTVKVLVKKYEFWEIEAPNRSEAADNYADDRVFDTTHEECEVAGIYPKAA